MREERIGLSPRERDRLRVLHEVEGRHLRQVEAASQSCHSERSEESVYSFPRECWENPQMLRGVYPEPNAEILRSAQDDKRRAQHDTR
jgi:hypothetical protein